MACCLSAVGEEDDFVELHHGRIDLERQSSAAVQRSRIVALHVCSQAECRLQRRQCE